MANVGLLSTQNSVVGLLLVCCWFVVDLLLVCCCSVVFLFKI